MLGESISFAVGNVALGSKYFEFEIEDFVQFTVPIVHKPSRNHHQSTFKLTTTSQFT